MDERRTRPACQDPPQRRLRSLNRSGNPGRESQAVSALLGRPNPAVAQDSDLIFSIPEGKLEDVLDGLRSSEKTGRMLPVQPSLQPEHEMPEGYVKIARMMGMDVK